MFSNSLLIDIEPFLSQPPNNALSFFHPFLLAKTINQSCKRHHIGRMTSFQHLNTKFKCILQTPPNTKSPNQNTITKCIGRKSIVLHFPKNSLGLIKLMCLAIPLYNCSINHNFRYCSFLTH
ncbi:hypothetical protein AQUCO_04500016v1 [Aquilegia coerulea]|uniref:Uncharacterized protein n=1 Tax=Aquilegia coerulea TaxID=218851 RepID=A0A2G5CLC7_AQUCA|nr:hypothetical protein AQUCO_04500016v1 [Aquilegia coerulea]